MPTDTRGAELAPIRFEAELFTFDDTSLVRLPEAASATNKCRNVLRAARRRPAKAWDIPGVEPPEPTRPGKAVWLEAFPDSLLDSAFDLPVGRSRRRAERVPLFGVRRRWWRRATSG